MSKGFYNVTQNIIINISSLEQITLGDGIITLRLSSGLTNTYNEEDLTQQFKNFLYTLNK
jgi:hypothetical protein